MPVYELVALCAGQAGRVSLGISSGFCVLGGKILVKFKIAEYFITRCCGNHWFQLLCYSKGIVCVSNFCICGIPLVISTASRLMLSQTFLPVIRVFYYVLKPVNMPNISDKPQLMTMKESFLPKKPAKMLVCAYRSN